MMAEPVSRPEEGERRAGGYHEGEVEVVLSVDAVAREAEALRAEIPEERLLALAGGEPFLSIRGLRAGYGAMEILHDFTLHVARGQSLCLIGPNGAGKSTGLHSADHLTHLLAAGHHPGGGNGPETVARTRPGRLARPLWHVEARVARRGDRPRTIQHGLP